MSKRKLKQRQKPTQAEDSKPLKLRSGTVHNKSIRVPETPQIPLEEPENGWICSRCSTVNSLDDIECVACFYHRKRFVLHAIVEYFLMSCGNRCIIVVSVLTYFAGTQESARLQNLFMKVHGLVACSVHFPNTAFLHRQIPYF
jgi:hypothetical protein